MTHSTTEAFSSAAELHLFVIWNNARHCEQKIIADIAANFSVLNIYEIQWQKNLFNDNLSRFYGANLPKDCNKEIEIGRDSFLIAVVIDDKPQYSIRQVKANKKARVNTNTFEAKTRYREWASNNDKAGSLVHGSNTSTESNHDLTLLLGINAKDFIDKNGGSRWTGEYTKIQQDVAGGSGWKSLEEMFYVLNNTMTYVVLRNYENMINELVHYEHPDIDLLVLDRDRTAQILNARRVPAEEYRVQYKVTISGKEIPCDLRFLGDDYYDKTWQHDILLNRRLDGQGFYVPSETDHYYSLLYHAIIHKKIFLDEYRVKLADMASKLGLESPERCMLDEYMKNQMYQYVRPKDMSVRYTIGTSKMPKDRILHRLLKFVWRTAGEPEWCRNWYHNFNRKEREQRV
ncbi:MAG: hypothetical protein A2Y10_12430 [Planctomycetes bacterium GWF2_41_51]|nr:MAG: hypothetical protein A2Y10_12430 [Planctomycetes bacterium GWF2_41_51]HBG27228.1 hypothetical protein [Phycisphaerales bacterium]